MTVASAQVTRLVAAIRRVWRARRAGLWRWTRRLALGSLAAALILGASLTIAVYAWSYDPDDLDTAGPIILLDRHGRELRTVPAPGGLPSREAWVELGDLPPMAVAAVVHSEDEHYWDHPGVDWRGVARAAVLNIKERRLGYGGSTITMQLVRMVHHREEPRTFRNKLVESVLALRLERALGKREILEHYLNRAYYGNGAYGLEAAAQTYFGKPARSLSDGEATLLACLPRAPAAYDPLEHPRAAIRRRDYVLSLLAERGVVDPGEIGAAIAQPLDTRRHPPHFLAGHFTDWVLEELPHDLERGGVVRTTLDLELQRQLEHRVAEHVAALEGQGLGQAGVLVLDTATGEVLAAVGSRDYQSGQLNILTHERHPGSALKPFVYALAIAGGESPASITYDILDVPSDYRANMVTQPERGPVRYREALAGSYNLAAIHVLEKVGVSSLMTLLRRAGAGDVELDPDSYGLRLALGAARVRLAHLASAYGAFVRGGTMVPPTLIASADKHRGGAWIPEPEPEIRLLPEPAAWLVMDMMSDPVARRPAFGSELPVDLPYPIAVKTGTSRGFADTVAIGVTRELTVAAWAGNFDGEPTQGLVAMEAAAPLVRAGFLLAARGQQLTLPEAPPEIASAEVCPLSGKRPGPDCPHRKSERFHRDQIPKDTCTWHRRDADGRPTIQWPAEATEWAAGRGLLSRR